MGLLSRSQGFLEQHAHQVERDLPPKNCTCYINPPCSDCIDWSGERDYLRELKHLINDLKAAQLIHPDL